MPLGVYGLCSQPVISFFFDANPGFSGRTMELAAVRNLMRSFMQDTQMADWSPNVDFRSTCSGVAGSVDVIWILSAGYASGGYCPGLALIGVFVSQFNNIL